nr:prohibitin family protein [Chroococcus sp. FPU101]
MSMTKKRSLPSYQVLILFFLLSLILLNPFVIIEAGKRGVVMKFGEVQDQRLNEGLHLIIPIINTVEKLTVRIQKQDISAEASSKDLQEVFTDVALNWHIIPAEVNKIYQEIGVEEQVIERIINPAIEEVLKAVMAKYTAEEIITEREEVKAQVDNLLQTRLSNYHIQVDDLSLVHVHFSERFMEAVEAKQIAEQEAKKAGFTVIKAQKEAEVMVNLAQGEARSQMLLQESLTPEILKKQAIDKWNGNLPIVISNDALQLLDMEDLIKAPQTFSK